MSIKNFFSSLFESFFKRGSTRINTSIARSYNDLTTQDLYTLLQNIKQVSKDRKTRISEYRAMLSDGITLSAIELIAEDATQQDPERGETVWISCPENSVLEKEMNEFLREKVKIETMAFAIAFNVAAFGDCYLNTFADDETYKQSGGRVGDYFEIETAEFVTHLYSYGKPSGYLLEENPNSSRRNNDSFSNVIVGERNYIHFSADNGMNYAKVAVSTQDSVTGEVSDKIYTIRYGNSFLEAARSYYKITTTLQDLLLLSRLTRSQFYRLFSVEVGAADDRETTRIIKELRDVVSTSQTVQPNTSISTVASPMSTGGNVYFPTRNGKGSVSVDTIGGDFNVSEMADVDFLNNKYAGALKVPKAFLGTTDDMPSGLGDTTLTRLDIRYARTVKRLQRIIKTGIHNLILWKCSLDNIVPPEFTVKMYQCSSIEEDERSQMIEAQMTKLNNLLDMLDRIDEDQKINRLAILPYLINTYNDKTLYNFLKDNIELLNKKDEKNEEKEEGEGGDDEGYFGEQKKHKSKKNIIKDEPVINNKKLKTIFKNRKNIDNLKRMDDDFRPLN